MSGTSSNDPIVEAFRALASRRGNDVAIAAPSHRATFAEIDALAASIAAGIGDGRGRLIGLAAPNGPALLAGFLAIRQMNRPALLLDPYAPREDRRRAASVLGADSILECADAWPSSAAGVHHVAIGTGASSDALQDIAVVKLTSGSTGVPRGVAVSAHSLMADEDALFRTMGFRDDDRILAAIPMSHSYGFTTLALSAIVRGLTLIVPADQSPFAPLAAANDLRATIFPTVPSYISALLKMSQPPAWPQTIRLVISAGAMLRSDTASRFRKTYNLPIHVFYGSSECGGICYDREGTAAERGTVGSPVDGVTISLQRRDGDPLGEGLVCVESNAVGETYVPEPDPRLSGGRFETRDLAAWRDGELMLQRRVDDVINVRGHKVDPSEVELVLAGLAGVEEVVVLGIALPDRRDEIVRAIVACPSGSLDSHDIAAWCRARLADHKVPRSVVIVDAIPRTDRGKIDRTALIDLQSTVNG